MTIHVVWQSWNEGTPNRGYWDQGMLEDLFAKEMWRVPGGSDFESHDDIEDVPQDVDGVVLIIPARYHIDKVPMINEQLARFRWVLFVCGGEEEGKFPLQDLDHPNLITWLMSPHAELGASADRYIGVGYPPQARGILRGFGNYAQIRELDWFFAGQVTHSRRAECVAALRELPKGMLVETPGFTQGVDQQTYYRYLASSKVAPCPSGPETPDTFRLYEALEAQCIPLVDVLTPRDTEDSGFWRYLFAEHPLPSVKDWAIAGDLIENLKDRPRYRSEISSWWQSYKRSLAWNLQEDLARLEASQTIPLIADDLITVLIPTSPIPSHPSTQVLEETLQSVRSHLPYAEILIMVDGVREEQRGREADYNEFIRRLLWKSNFDWKNVLPIVFSEHNHQARMTRETLKMVKTPAILFVEHDTPICEEIPFWEMAKAVEKGDLDVIRLLHEAYILPDYAHMRIDKESQQIGGLPIVRISQWSQRPHVASTRFYRQIMEEHFSSLSRTMIEDKMHGICHSAFTERGKAGWNDYRIGIYAPEGDQKRSVHTDGRATDPKYDMYF